MMFISVDIRALEAVKFVNKDDHEMEPYQPRLPSTFDVSKHKKSQVITTMLHQHSIHIGPTTPMFGLTFILISQLYT